MNQVGKKIHIFKLYPTVITILQSIQSFGVFIPLQCIYKGTDEYLTSVQILQIEEWGFRDEKGLFLATQFRVDPLGQVLLFYQEKQNKIKNKQIKKTPTFK